MCLQSTALAMLHFVPCCPCLQTRECVSAVPVEPGLVTQPLTEDQWATLDRINDSLTKEYAVRRQMLLTRCDVTVQSFRWSDNTKVPNVGLDFVAEIRVVSIGQRR